jgi:hypothetical protein
VTSPSVAPIDSLSAPPSASPVASPSASPSAPPSASPSASVSPSASPSSPLFPKVNGIDHDVQSLTYNSLNFGPSETTKIVQLRYAKGDNGGKLELRIGGPTGTLTAEYSPTMTGNWDTFTTVDIEIDDVIGIQDLTLVGKGGSGVMNIDWFELSA